MDSIPFTKVSLEEAKTALQSPAIPGMATIAAAPDWQRKRRPLALVNQEMSLNAFKWMASLPLTLRPHALARHYPRIINRLAEIWHRPLQCETYLDELVLDKRGTRHGFAREVAGEIAALKTHFMSTSKTVHFDIWDKRIGVD